MERIRKASIKRGTISQVPFSFRLDSDLQDYLNSKPNKGRFINNVIRDAMEEEAGGSG